MNDGGWSWDGNGVMSMNGKRYVYSVYATGEETANGLPLYRWVVFDKVLERHVGNGTTVGEDQAIVCAIESVIKRKVKSAPPPPAPQMQGPIKFDPEPEKPDEAPQPVMMTAAERGYVANLLADSLLALRRKPETELRKRTEEGITLLIKRMKP